MSVRSRFAAFAALAALGACGEQAPPPVEETAAPAVTAPAALLASLSTEQAEGRVIYQTMCWTCHGTGGRGDGPALQSDTVGQPQNFVAGGYADLSVDELVTRFEASLTGDGVDPAHPHMRSVIALLKPDRFRTALSYVPVLAYPSGIPGSAITGMDLYETRCAACHGREGDGQGYAAEALVVVKPADFRADSLVATGNWEGLFHRIQEGGRTVHGSSMPPWGVALSDAEMWDLVAYVATFREGALPPLPGAGG